MKKWNKRLIGASAATALLAGTANPAYADKHPRDHGSIIIIIIIVMIAALGGAIALSKRSDKPASP